MNDLLMQCGQTIISMSKLIVDLANSGSSFEEIDCLREVLHGWLRYQVFVLKEKEK